MALLNHPRWALWNPKPITSKGTAKAFAAGEVMFQRSGVNVHLKNAIKKSIKSERLRAE